MSRVETCRAEQSVVGRDHLKVGRLRVVSPILTRLGSHISRLSLKLELLGCHECCLQRKLEGWVIRLVFLQKQLGRLFFGCLRPNCGGLLF